MSSATDSDVRATLARRAALLDRLAGTPAEKPRLEAEFEMPRSTVDYAVRDLLATGLVERSSDGYRATTFGSLVYEAYRTYQSTVRDLCLAADVLDELPVEALDDPAVFRDAEVVVSEAHAPDRATCRLLELVRAADQVVGVMPTVLQQYVDVFHERLVDGGQTAEFVVSTAVLERLTSTYATAFGEMVQTGRVGVYEAPDPLSFGLVLCTAGQDRRVCVVAHTETGPRGLLESESATSIEWARGLYRQYRRAADHLVGPTVENG